MKLSIHGSQIFLGVVVASTIAISNGQKTDFYDCNNYPNQAFCPELSICVYTLEQTCPLKGQGFVGPAILNCDEGRCSLNDECIVYNGAYTLGGFYLDKLDGHYGILDSCSVNCTGCVEVTEDFEDEPVESEKVIGWEQDNGCFLGAGQVYCEELDSCIFPNSESCPLQGESYTGPTLLQCDQGRCSINSRECTVFDGNKTLHSLYLNELDGQYALLPTCSVNCTGCEEIKANDVVISRNFQQENGCYLGAGQVFCPELSKCIFPTTEGCPLQGQTFSGRTNLQCDKGRCNLNKECYIYDENGDEPDEILTIYLSELDGKYSLAEVCSANCTGCTQVKEDSQNRLLRGTKEI